MNDSFAEQARRIYDDTLVWDAHAGFEPTPTVDLTGLSRWKTAGVGFLSINVGYDVMDWRDTVKAIGRIRRWLDAAPDFQRVDTVAALESAAVAGRMAVAFDIEGMRALDESLDMIQLYHDLGVRQMLFAYNRNNAAGGGCHDDDTGLTDFGRAAIDELNRVGIVVDCSHCGYRTTMEAMERSVAPVVFSHSNPRRLHDHERNILDEQARACAATGGVVGLNGISGFLGDDDIRTERLADHVAYWIDLIGPSHVGIGLDYFFEVEGVPGIMDTLERNQHFWPARQYPPTTRFRCVAPEALPGLAEEMLRRGYPESDIRGVLGDNFLRIAEQVWR